MTNIEQLKQKGSELGATAIALINVDQITFVDDFRKGCEANTRGNYGKNWMCPPEVGAIDELKSSIRRFSTGLLFQKVHQLTDSFDFEGMQQGVIVHEKVFRSLFECIDVNGLLSLHDIPYNNGPNTVSYVGLFLFNSIL